MDKKRQLIYLGALLHDIGKFYQRADKYGTNNSQILTEYSKNLEDVLCPYNKAHNSFTHKHVLWTAEFFNKFEKQFKNLIKLDDKNSLIRLAAAHHRPDNNSLFEKIIQKADWYSSGVDRSKDEYSIKDGLDENSWDSFKKKRLVSVFESINNKENKYEYSHPVTETSLENHFFPKPNSEFSEAPDYYHLWEKFEGEFKFIQADNFNIFSETLLNLLSKYTTTIPSSTINLPDVSLYDHLKTTAAFSICLFDYLTEKNKNDIKINSNEKPFLLIGGDISGIQNFIYDIISKNAAKNLKGRSFYIQLLSDSIIKKILFDLNLFRANIIYGSGGSFFILAPNTNKNIEILAKTKNEISESIFSSHSTLLFAAIDSIAFGEYAIFNGGIGELWYQLHKKLDAKKQLRYSTKLKKDYDFFFKPSGIGKKQLRDAITGEEILPNEKTKEIEGNKIKYDTYKQIQLGKKLKDADYWVISKNKLTYWGDENEYNPSNLGIYHYFLSKDDLDKKREELKKSADNVEIFIVNDLNFLESAITGKDNLYNYTFYGGNDFPAYNQNQKDDDGTKHYKGEPISFDKLTGNEDFKRLGILRMDVDNLGQIFASGFMVKNRTFSRLSTLSRSLDYFFKGYLNTIWKKYKENTFILYSGGDDLFIVGKWDVLIEMAEEINTKFNEWTCKNPALSISGGITIVTGKFPILKASEYAAEAENIAKEYINSKIEKNAFTLMGFPLNRNIEYPVVKKLKTKIKDSLNDDLPKAFISNIYNFYENRKMQIEKKQNERWQWQLAYNISRMIQRTKNNDTKKLLSQIKIDVFANTYKGKQHNFKYHTLEIVNIAARWAELELRSN